MSETQVPYGREKNAIQHKSQYKYASYGFLTILLLMLLFPPYQWEHLNDSPKVPSLQTPTNYQFVFDYDKKYFALDTQKINTTSKKRALTKLDSVYSTSIIIESVYDTSYKRIKNRPKSNSTKYSQPSSAKEYILNQIQNNTDYYKRIETEIAGSTGVFLIEGDSVNWKMQVDSFYNYLMIKPVYHLMVRKLYIERLVFQISLLIVLWLLLILKHWGFKNQEFANQSDNNL